MTNLVGRLVAWIDGTEFHGHSSWCETVVIAGEQRFYDVFRADSCDCGLRELIDETTPADEPKAAMTNEKSPLDDALEYLRDEVNDGHDVSFTNAQARLIWDYLERLNGRVAALAALQYGQPHEPEAPQRPASFEFAMDFLGDPEEKELRAYIEALERRQIEPTGELATKLRELAESQTELDPEARRVLYSRMRELYVR